MKIYIENDFIFKNKETGLYFGTGRGETDNINNAYTFNGNVPNRLMWLPGANINNYTIDNYNIVDYKEEKLKVKLKVRKNKIIQINNGQENFKRMV